MNANASNTKTLSPAERMARVLVEEGAYGVPWEDASEDDRAECMDRARHLLTVAGYEVA